MALSDLIALRNKLQPHSNSNNDSLQFDYSFWTDIEKIAKKQREKALETLKKASKNPDKPGIILRGSMYQTELKVVNMRSFDKEVFIDHIATQYPEIPRHTLREMASNSLVEGTPRRSFVVTPKEEA